MFFLVIAVRSTNVTFYGDILIDEFKNGEVVYLVGGCSRTEHEYPSADNISIRASSFIYKNHWNLSLEMTPCFFRWDWMLGDSGRGLDEFKKGSAWMRLSSIPDTKHLVEIYHTFNRTSLGELIMIFFELQVIIVKLGANVWRLLVLFSSAS